jgi:hypothetical protein
MGIRKQNSPFSQSVDIRRLHLRMPAHATDPVVQVINRNQQHIGWNRFLCAGVYATTSQKCACPDYQPF